MSHIHVERWGSAGPRVILVHGGVQGTSSAGHRNWRAQSDLGEQGWQLLVPDRPGHGNSPDPGRPDDAVADAEWVSDMAAEAGAGGAHLVGHSFGGLITLAAAARNPGAVKSLTLIEPALFKIATISSADAPYRASGHHSSTATAGNPGRSCCRLGPGRRTRRSCRRSRRSSLRPSTC